MTADGLARLNVLPRARAEAELRQCCGSAVWARALAARRPFRDVDELVRAADAVWAGLGTDAWLDALRAHPRIGERKPADGEPAAGAPDRSAGWSAREQSGTASAPAAVLAALADGNRMYEERFGHIFVICASGRSAEEMLAALRERLDNDPGAELRIAAEEQRKITELRLRKLLGGDS